ncbi:hypothetical protein Mapa_012925 [Marchantia paleacea]|nr:hypothetical protein Mapa_012925 [Marchantia paleacea]
MCMLSNHKAHERKSDIFIHWINQGTSKSISTMYSSPSKHRPTNTCLRKSDFRSSSKSSSNLPYWKQVI